MFLWTERCHLKNIFREEKEYVISENFIYFFEKTNKEKDNLDFCQLESIEKSAMPQCPALNFKRCSRRSSVGLNVCVRVCK